MRASSTPHNVQDKNTSRIGCGQEFCGEQTTRLSSSRRRRTHISTDEQPSGSAWGGPQRLQQRLAAALMSQIRLTTAWSCNATEFTEEGD